MVETNRRLATLHGQENSSKKKSMKSNERDGLRPWKSDWLATISFGTPKRSKKKVDDGNVARPRRLRWWWWWWWWFFLETSLLGCYWVSVQGRPRGVRLFLRFLRSLVVALSTTASLRRPQRRRRDAAASVSLFFFGSPRVYLLPVVVVVLLLLVLLLLRYPQASLIHWSTGGRAFGQSESHFRRRPSHGVSVRCVAKFGRGKRSFLFSLHTHTPRH